MRNRIIENAKNDIPLYFDDLKKIWDTTHTELLGSEDDLYEIYLQILKIRNWKNSLNHLGIVEQDLILNEIFEDVNSSFFLAMFGLYRSAHMHLRSMIELSLQLLYFIHHPIEYKLWQNGDFVIKFDKLQEYLIKNPVFDTDINDLIIQIFNKWKTFSKHIHAEAPIFFQCEKDIRKTNNYSKKDFGIWKSNYCKTIYLLNKLFLLFFKGDINRIQDSSRNILMEMLSEDDRELLILR